MDYRERIINYLKEGNGMITTEYCRERGIPTIYLTRLLNENILKRIHRGLYVSKDGDHDELYFLQHKYKQIVFSYETALSLQGLTDKIPQAIDVSVPYSYKINNVPENIKVYYVKKEIAELGMVEEETVFGNKIYVYNIERIICDIILNKDDIDPEVYTKTIRQYAQSKSPNINRLFIYAEKMGIVKQVRTIMEVIYE